MITNLTLAGELALASTLRCRCLCNKASTHRLGTTGLQATVAFLLLCVSAISIALLTLIGSGYSFGSPLAVSAILPGLELL